ncbi:MAG: cytochrome C biogenesis protein [Candidatus Marinimicrobia bacterium]|jgi:cytochrome c-type biogenesis protein|nr:cytochrome C biogenesis protein [Candidatus Neomarinimicrobiota bacterium]
MINSLFSWLSEAMSGSPVVVLAAAFIWGILSILLSPCHLSSIPLIVGFIDEQGRVSTKRAFYIASLFSVGILVTIAVIGVITSLMGRMMGDIGVFGNYFVAIIFFIVGLHLLGLIPFPFLNGANQPAIKKRGLLAAFILGLVFGIALGPCTFAYMAPVLTVALTVSASQVLFGALLIIVYGLGHCSVIVLAGTFTGMVQKYLNWNEKSKGAVILKKICGVLVIFGGIYLLWSAK